MKCYRLTFADGRAGLMVRSDEYVPSAGSMYALQDGEVLRIIEATDGALDLCEATEVLELTLANLVKL